MKACALISILPILLLASCANPGGGSDSTAESPRPLSERLSGERGYKQDAEGNWVAQSERRSSYDSDRDSPYFKGEFEGKEYKTGDYAKKSWWATNEIDRKAFSNNADGNRFRQGSRFQQQAATEGGTDAGLAQNFDTGTYSTGAAREAGSQNIDKPSDAETDFRRRVFTPPDETTDWKAQRSLSLGQTKGLTGR